MIIIASLLAFVLVQPSTCDEVYPISVAKNIVWPMWLSDNYNETQGTTYDEMFPSLNSVATSQNQIDLVWIKKDIVDKYGFVKHAKDDKWTKQPDFKANIGTPQFIADAGRVEKFFKRNNDWETSKNNPEFRQTGTCTELLYVTAARYLLVTHILFEQSGKKLIPCARSAENKIVIPDSGVCFPAPYGSATCTSDYDVGLIGKNAGFLTEKFNAYFQGSSGFGKASELVFDTNVYAFTLEFAMPFYFDKLPPYFADKVANNEKTITYKMQELASAYFKIYKYNAAFYMAFTDAIDEMKAPKSKKELQTWLETFQALDSKVGMRIEAFQNSVGNLRVAHNAEYQKYVKKMSQQGGYIPALLGTLAKALLYAAEAYHTRGAIRHIVGGTQMKVIDLSPRTPLTVTDLWVSMIENWGESNKEYNHCKTAPLVKCFLKMSKYMWRVFDAMRMVRVRLPTEARLKGVVRFGEQFGDPLYAMQMWLQYKRKGDAEIPNRVNDVKSFFTQFGCTDAIKYLQNPIPETCLNKMNDKINDYNKALASLVKDDIGWQRR